MVQVKGRIWKTGNSYVMTIPAAYVKNGVLHENQIVEADLVQPAQKNENGPYGKQSRDYNLNAGFSLSATRATATAEI